MRKINIEELNGQTYDDGSEILFKAGYIQDDSIRDDNVADCDYILDTYFVLYDEDDEAVDVKSFVQHINERNDEINDDINDEGSLDFIVKEEWVQI